MKIAIGSDHAGFELKKLLTAHVQSLGHTVNDVGCHNEQSCDYADFAAAVAREVASKRADRGIVLCGSGVGANMAANKVKGARAGICHDHYSAHQGVEHDDMNVLCLGSEVVGPSLARELVDAFLNATFDGGERYVARLLKVADMERTMKSGEVTPA